MTKKLIQTNALIDSDWVNYARRTIGDYGSKYSYYIHTESEAIEIGAGVYGRQTIYPLDISRTDEEFLISSIEKLDRLIDLDFERVWDQSEASSRFFVDSVIELEGNPLGLVLANRDQNNHWFEILLDGSKLVDQSYRRYAALHEYGTLLGLSIPSKMEMVIAKEARIRGQATFSLKIQLWPIAHRCRENGRNGFLLVTSGLW